MDIKELKQKSPVEWRQLLTECRNKLRDERFKVASKQSGNVRELRHIRLTIARILTLLNAKK